MTFEETLDLFDGSFNEFAKSVTEDRYALWFGSAISRDRVPPLPEIAIKVIAYIQSRISTHDPNCRFKHALESVLELAGLSDDERLRNDIREPVATWPDRDAIANRLTLQYSRMLDIQVAGESPDFLLWDALGVVPTYGDAALDPDAEHFCIAGLIAEGVASTIVSANWDGLIEKAVLSLMGTGVAMNVCVRPEETRRPPSRSTLYKLHGCAVLAGQNPALYRHMLVARKSQIDRYTTDNANEQIVQRLIDIATSRQTLIVGLSAQDGNIQGIFAAAQQRMEWPYPSHPPAIIIAGGKIGPDQDSLLQNVYLAHYSPANRAQIQQSSLFTAYAKPFLLSLFVYVLSAKLAALLEIALQGWAATSTDQLKSGLGALRRKVAQSGVSGDHRRMIELVLHHCTRTLSLFSDGAEPKAGSPRYRAITNTPVHQLALDPTLPGTGLAGLGLALGLLGLGENQGHWTIREPDPGLVRAGTLRLVANGTTSQVFLAADAEAVLNLLQDGLLDYSDPAILIHSREVRRRMPRSPKGTYGRSGTPGMREISLRAVVGSSVDADQLMERFREEIAI